MGEQMIKSSQALKALSLIAFTSISSAHAAVIWECTPELPKMGIVESIQVYQSEDTYKLVFKTQWVYPGAVPNIEEFKMEFKLMDSHIKSFFNRKKSMYFNVETHMGTEGTMRDATLINKEVKTNWRCIPDPENQ
jgi:hypothetical protein